MGNKGNAFISFPVSGWDIDDDFTSYANDVAFDAVYPTSNAVYFNPNSSTNKIDYTTTITTDLKCLVRDFGSAISDTAHVTRFRWNITAKTLSPTGNTAEVVVGWSASDQTVDARSANDDGLALVAYQDNLARNYWTVYADATKFDGSIGGGSFGTVYTTVPTAGDNYFIEQIRSTATAYATGLFSDEYVSSVESQSDVIPSTVQSLRYWKMAGPSTASDPQGSQNGNVNTYLRFADGVTVAP